jgi:diaminopimelate epimerase
MDGLAASVVGTDGARVNRYLLPGQRFVKMTGSGNDFVVVDARSWREPPQFPPETIGRICARGTGVGADGLVVLAPEAGVDFRMLYFNADGSRAAMCGNAALCSTRLVLGGDAGRELRFATDAGLVAGRLRDSLPEVDLAAISVMRPEGQLKRRTGESRLGFVLAGVPHVTVLCDDVTAVDVVGRGREIRLAPELRPEGANANFVARGSGGRWDIRTYERGVEAETLACGTGAIASALLLQLWGEAASPVTLRTQSELFLTVRLRQDASNWLPSLSGEGRIVFSGELAEI